MIALACTGKFCVLLPSFTCSDRNGGYNQCCASTPYFYSDLYTVRLRTANPFYTVCIFLLFNPNFFVCFSFLTEHCSLALAYR